MDAPEVAWTRLDAGVEAQAPGGKGGAAAVGYCNSPSRKIFYIFYSISLPICVYAHLYPMYIGSIASMHSIPTVVLLLLSDVSVRS